MESQVEHLFILGNGFDLSHGRLTSYYDFKKFLILRTKYDMSSLNDDFKEFVTDEELIQDISTSIGDEDLEPDFPPLPQMLSKGDWEFNEKELITWYLQLLDSSGIDEDWSSYEESLGNVDFSSAIEDFNWDSDDAWDNVRNNEDNASNADLAFQEIHKYFVDWIKLIENYPVKKNEHLRHLFLSAPSLFLSFNYTDTLETYYKVCPDLVNHIHGYCDPKNSDKDTPLIVGGPVTDDTNYFEHIPGSGELDDLTDRIQKNVPDIIANNEFFFQNLSNIRDIYCYGFSFSRVDIPYIERILQSVSSCTIWHLYKYDTSTTISQKNLLVNKLKVPSDKVLFFE